LIAGSPEEIPFDFQYQLDVNYAVGRLDFETPEEYQRYARSVIRAEAGNTSRERSVALFEPVHPGDQMTAVMAEVLVRPVFEELEAKWPNWKVTALIGAEATKARLGGLMGGDETPALLFVSGHGMGLFSERNRPSSSPFRAACSARIGRDKRRRISPAITCILSRTFRRRPKSTA
jgi:hypothetical protein